MSVPGGTGRDGPALAAFLRWDARLGGRGRRPAESLGEMRERLQLAGEPAQAVRTVEQECYGPVRPAQAAAAAVQVLDNLGQALGSAQLAAYRFRVEGHTDTVGPGAMNQDLSERRAAAVRDFLVQRHGLAAGRIEAAGLGEQQLLVPTPDEVPEPRNRRVQVINIGG